MDLLEALSRPSRDDKWFNAVVVGGLLSLVPVVNFICIGYLIEAMEKVRPDQTKLPLWDNWGEKFLFGLLTSLAAFLYLVIPVVLLVAGSFVGETLGQYRAVPYGGLWGFGLGTFLGLILLALFILIWPMAMAHYAYKRNFAAFFDLVSVFGHIRLVLGDYLVVLILFFLLQFILAVIVGVIPVIGFIFSLPAGFYLSLAFSQALGLLFHQGLEQKARQGPFIN